MSTIVTGSFSPSSVTYLQQIGDGSGQFTKAGGYPSPITVNVNEYVIVTFVLEATGGNVFSTHTLGTLTWGAMNYTFGELITWHENTVIKIHGEIAYTVPDYATISYVWRKFKSVTTPLSFSLT